MRILILLALVISGTGCVSPKVGMTMEEYSSQCRFAWWQSPTSLTLSSGETLLQCADADYQIFDENGILQRVSSREEVISILEDDKCKSFGVSPGEAEYINCRMTFAHIRAQEEALARAQQIQASQALMNYGLMLQNMGQPQTVNVRANCVSQQMGTYTYYSCQ